MAVPRKFKRSSDVNQDASAVHYPHRNGPVCGLTIQEQPALMDARSYSVDPEALTCDACSDYITRTQAHSDMVHKAQADQAAGAMGDSPRSGKGK